MQTFDTGAPALKPLSLVPLAVSVLLLPPWVLAPPYCASCSMHYMFSHAPVLEASFLVVPARQLLLLQLLLLGAFGLP